MDRIFVDDLRVDVIVGLWDWERAMTQTVSIDLEMAWDIRAAAADDDIDKTLDYRIRAAAADDDIDKTLDYRSVSKRVAAFLKETEFLLIETMAERIAALIRDEFGVTWLRVTIHKPAAVRGARDVGVSIERGEL